MIVGVICDRFWLANSHVYRNHTSLAMMWTSPLRTPSPAVASARPCSRRRSAGIAVHVSVFGSREPQVIKRVSRVARSVEYHDRDGMLSAPPSPGLTAHRAIQTSFSPAETLVRAGGVAPSSAGVSRQTARLGNCAGRASSDRQEAAEAGSGAGSSLPVADRRPCRQSHGHPLVT